MEKTTVHHALVLKVVLQDSILVTVESRCGDACSIMFGIFGVKNNGHGSEVAASSVMTWKEPEGYLSYSIYIQLPNA
jgi:hypothetical protein